MTKVQRLKIELELAEKAAAEQARLKQQAKQQAKREKEREQHAAAQKERNAALQVWLGATIIDIYWDRLDLKIITNKGTMTIIEHGDDMSYLEVQKS